MTEAVFEAGSWIYKMLFTLLIAVILVACVGIFVKTQVNTIDIQREVLRNRILYDPHGIWTVEQGVMQPGVLNSDSFNQKHLDEAFVYPDNFGGARLTLIDGTKKDPLYINEPAYTSISTKAALTLKRGGTVTTHVYPVVINDGNRRNAYLIIDIAMPERT